MKTTKIKQKVSAKIAKAKARIRRKCGKAVKSAVVLAVLAVLTGCATSGQQPAKSQTQNNEVHDCIVVIGATNVKLPDGLKVETQNETSLPDFGIMTQAQALESSGTETYSQTSSPTTDVKPTTTMTYGLSSPTASGAKWIDSLDSGCAKLLSSWLSTGDANGTMTVTKKDGTKETVTCANGTCTTSSGDCISCSPCKDCQL